MATDPPSYRSGEIDDEVSALAVESVFGVEDNQHADEEAYEADVSLKDQEVENDAETEKVSSDDEVAGAAARPLTSPFSGGGEHRNPVIRSITTTAEATLTRHYSVDELVRTLGQGEAGTENLPPELERRVRDFLLAQRKRREKYGPHQPWGIFGMYAHLANVRIDLEWAEDAAYRRQHNEPYLSWTDFDDARLQALHRPWFTYFIILLCTIMLIVSFAVNDWKIEPLSVNNMIGPSKDTLIKIGARDTDLIINEHQWYRIVSPLILHAGIIHYVVNMIAFWFIGVAVEQTHGILNTIALFMIPGIGGTILSAIFLPQYISVGASGGIFGLIGGCIADIGMNWKLLFIHHADETKKQVWRRNFWAVFILISEVIFNIVSRLMLHALYVLV
jgi:membrane associated rhomboid family serine protease